MKRQEYVALIDLHHLVKMAQLSPLIVTALQAVTDNGELKAIGLRLVHPDGVLVSDDTQPTALKPTVTGQIDVFHWQQSEPPATPEPQAPADPVPAEQVIIDQPPAPEAQVTETAPAETGEPVTGEG